MGKYVAVAIAAATLALCACNDSSTDVAGRDSQTSETVNKNPQVDADPTPDGTTNGVPVK